jgi:hypothetical protein
MLLPTTLTFSKAHGTWQNGGGFQAVIYRKIHLQILKISAFHFWSSMVAV